MHPRHALTLALLLGRPALAGPVSLQALTPTSGTGAELLLDGDAKTGWRLDGDTLEEGVLLRLEQPLTLDGVSVRACAGAAPVKLGVYVDTADAGTVEATPARDAELKFDPRKEARSLFLRIQAPAPQQVCLGEVRLLQGDKPLDVKPPRAVKGTVQASSVLAPADAYHPGFLFDGRTDFGWVEGAKGTGQGESITLTLAEPVELVALELWNGYQRSEDHFRKNARAGQLALSVDGGAPVSLPVKDTQGAQTLKLPAPMKGTTFKLTVEKAIAGTKYPDLVLSELRLVDKQGPLTVSTPDQEERRKALESELAGTVLREVVNRSWKNRCQPVAASGSRSLKLRTNHSFVLYSSVEGGDGSGSTTVTDGAWVVQKPGKPWSSVELFGRRQRSESNWEPYRGDVTQSSTRIMGGKLEMARVADLGEKEFKKLMADWDSSHPDSVGCVGEDAGTSYADLAKAGAIVIKGLTLEDLLVP